MTQHQTRAELAELFDILDRSLHGTPAEQRAAIEESRARVADLAKAA